MGTPNIVGIIKCQKIVFLLCFFLFPSFLSHAQELICLTHRHIEDDSISPIKSIYSCLPYSVPYIAVHSAPDVYIPTSTYESISIRLNLFFIQRNDGTGNFQQNNDEHQMYLDMAIEKLNNQYASLQQDLDTPYCYVGTSFISNAKVRFEDNRYYIRDEYGWDYSIHDLCPNFDTWYLSYLDNQIRLCDTIPQGINVFFTENADLYSLYENGYETHYLSGGAACSRFPSYSNMNFSSRVHMTDYYTMYWCKVLLENPNADDSTHNALLSKYSGWLANGLAHELGHSLDLLHPDDYTDYADPYKDCKNSIMMGPSKWKRNFLSPTLLGSIHYTLMGSNLQNYVPVNTYSGTKIVDYDMSFPKMRFYHSLSIRADVAMNCDMILPKQASICLQNGGTLTINGGSLHSITDTWNGIIVQDGSTLILSNTSILDYNIIIEDGGTLVIEGNITLSGDHYIRIKNGGCLCINEQATVALTSPFSVIEMYPSALLGCNNLFSSDCVSTIEDANIIGGGKIVTYNSVNFLQNEIILSDSLVTGSSVKAGYNVTNEKPTGSVIISSDGNLRIQATDSVILTRDIEVQQGGCLLIRPAQ